MCGPTGGAADPYTLADLQCYLNQFKPAHYSHGGREPLLYAVVLLLSVQPRGLLAFLAQVRRGSAECSARWLGGPLHVGENVPSSRIT